MAQTTAELTAEKERLQLEKDILKLQAEVVSARQQLSAAQSPPGQTPTEAAAEAKAKFDALAAQHNSQKAAADAQVAADKAQLNSVFGGTTNSGLSGSIDVKPDAGKGEATLLSAVAVSSAANSLSASVLTDIGDSKVLIYTGTEKPRFQHWRLFNMRQNLLNKAIALAKSLETQATTADSGLSTAPARGATIEGAPIAIAGAALEAAKNIGSFFQTDYQIGGIALSGDDTLLSAAVIRSLRANHKTVIDPSRYVPATGDAAITSLLEGLEIQLATAPEVVASSEQRAKELREKAAAKDTPAGVKSQLLNVAAMYDRAAVAWKGALDGYTAILKDMSTADSSGLLLAFKVADEKFLADRLAAGDKALFLKVNNAVGGYYTRKNIWTFLGGMPFYTMGGAVVTYALVEGTNGTVLSAGEVPVHSGYAKVNRIKDIVDRAGRTRPNVVSGNGAAGASGQ